MFTSRFSLVLRPKAIFLITWVTVCYRQASAGSQAIIVSIELSSGTVYKQLSCVVYNFRISSSVDDCCYYKVEYPNIVYSHLYCLASVVLYYNNCNFWLLGFGSWVQC